MKRILQKVIIRCIRLIDNKDNARLRAYYKNKYNISIGKYTYGYDIANVGVGSKIGSFCSIASGVKIGLMNHPVSFVSTNPFLYYASRGFIETDKNVEVKVGTVIEDDVWIGNNAVILPGLVIGKGSVIAAGAVVTKNIAPYEIVGGVPAKHIKWRFEDSLVREKLMKINWSEWDDREIKKHIDKFYDVNEFINEFGKED